MTVRLHLAHARLSEVRTLVSPLAEMCSALHTWSEADHHPASSSWTTAVPNAVPAGELAELRQWSALWSTQRFRLFYPRAVRGELTLSAELDILHSIPETVFVGMVAAHEDVPPDLAGSDDYAGPRERAAHIAGSHLAESAEAARVGADVRAARWPPRLVLTQH